MTKCPICEEDSTDCECQIVEECPRCKGKGSDTNDSGLMIICPRCDARGYIMHECTDGEN